MKDKCEFIREEKLMKLYSIFLAFQSLQIVLKLNLPYNKTLKIMKMYDNLKTYADLYINEERKIIERFKSQNKLAVSGNQLDFSVCSSKEQNQKYAQEYAEKINDLRNSEMEIDYVMAEINDEEMRDLDNPSQYQRIPGDVINKLKGFIEFGGD